MPLILRVQSYRKQSPDVALERSFDHLGGTIGRSDSNTLMLPDPGKYISRNHSKVDFADGAYTLMDLGSNPSWVNDRPLGAGKVARLEHGDRLLIGDYVLEVSIDEVAPQPLPLFQPEPPAPPPSLYEGPSFDELQDTLASMPILKMADSAETRTALTGATTAADPLGLNLLAPGSDLGVSGPAIDGSLFRGSEPDHASPQFLPMPAARLPAAVEPTPQPPVARAAPLIPDDYDPLADFLPPRLHQPAPAAPPYAFASAPAAAAQAAAPVAAVAQASAWAQAPAATFAGMPPPVAQPRAPQPVAHAQPLGSPQSNTDGAVFQALLRGLGLAGITPSRSPVETAELAGALLRVATDGTMAVLLARAMTKRESRLDMTVLGSQANNPLKFFPDGASALSQMLTNAMAGYMPPLKSMGSAFEDLKAHELAVIAGMRAALSAVLQRFNPALIEARQEPSGLMEKMRPDSRKAKMWDQMVELYGEIQRESDDDFQRLFGDQFSAAYEEQINRLQGTHNDL